MRLVFVLLSGVLFGAGLVVSGMTNPAKVIGFLDVFGRWDPALGFVMGGALSVFGVGLLMFKKFNLRLCSVDLPDTSADPVSKQMLVGSTLFGVGWGLSGFCPGPALANVSTLKTEVLIFIPIMLVGMLVAQRCFGLDK